jgi:hypothetical protein
LLLQTGLLLAPLGALGTSLVSVNGVGYALLAIVLFTLKDAAARGRLGASTFKALNIGGRCRCCSAAAAAAVGAAVAPAVAAWQLSSAGTHGPVCLVCLVHHCLQALLWCPSPWPSP